MYPTLYSVQISENFIDESNAIYRKSHGQYFTPIEIAKFMGSLVSNFQDTIRILDPGFGTGILTCALIENLCENNIIRKIELEAYENDLQLIKYGEQVLNYLKEWLSQRGIEFSFMLHCSDFVVDNYEKMPNQDFVFKSNLSSPFDIVISNPPYFKLSFKDERAKIAKKIIKSHPNIYAIFMYMSIRMTKEGGQFVFIVPRSFTSGYYFKLFREIFFKISKIERIHLFGSRKKPFYKDDILQENVIIKGVKEFDYSKNEKVTVSSSEDYRDLSNSNIYEYRISDIVDLHSEHKILHIPINEEEIEIIRTFKRWSGTLNKYNLQISTGPVVTFRAKEYLSPVREDDTYVPLYDLYNVDRMQFRHPIKKNGKAQFIKSCEETAPLLLKNKNYILLRRFSTKDDKRRLIASPYFMDLSQEEYIGLENHLNYVYRPNGNLDRNEVLGISALFNSQLFDKYFRIFNGNINVSATELRVMPLPPLETIKQIGDRLIVENNYINTDIDEILQNICEFNKNRK